MEGLAHWTHPATLEELPTLYNQVRGIIFPAFPIYDESHRTVLQDAILNHYLTRDICITPYARWQLMFNNHLMTTMPFFNNIYRQTSINPDVFSNQDYTRIIKRQGSVVMEKGTTDTTESQSTNTGKTVYVPDVSVIETQIDTPQSDLTNFLDNKYMSGASKSYSSGEDNTNVNNDSNVSGSIIRSGQDKDTEDKTITETFTGKSGNKPYYEMIGEYIQNIMTVDKLIIDSLEDLFFMIY